MRYIFVAFLFLGWSFYELSGGADFQPRHPQTPIATAAVAPAAPMVHVVSNPAPAKPRPFSAVSLVATPAIAPSMPVAAALATPEQDEAYEKAMAAATLDQVRSGLGQGLTLFSGNDPAGPALTLASLEQEGARADAIDPDALAGTLAGTLASGGTIQQAEWVEPPRDRREITGTRVNMRDGPGTIYPVLARLTIGQQVEVLGDSGTGWLRLRMIDGQQTGWISASLVSKPAR